MNSNLNKFKIYFSFIIEINKMFSKIEYHLNSSLLFCNLLRKTNCLMIKLLEELKKYYKIKQIKIINFGN
jgi:hypothetical protein